MPAYPRGWSAHVESRLPFLGQSRKWFTFHSVERQLTVLELNELVSYICPSHVPHRLFGNLLLLDLIFRLRLCAGSENHSTVRGYSTQDLRRGIPHLGTIV